MSSNLATREVSRRGKVLAMESEEELLLDDTADDREGGSDPESDIGLDQNKDV